MSGWPVVTLGDVFDIARGGSPRPIDQFTTDDADGINWIMIGDASEGSKYITKTRKRIRPEGAQRSRAVKPGDFLLTNSMSFGKPYIMRTSGCIHDGWLVLSPRRDGVDADFFYHLLGSKAVYSEFERRASGATVKNLNIDLVRGVKIPLPPLPEQWRIAEILDKADALRAKRRAALAQLDTLTQSIFLDMFGDPVTNPKGWERVHLGEMVERITKGESPKWQGFEYQDDGALFVTSENVRLGAIDLTTPKFISLEFNKKLERSELRPGDLLVNLVGASIGRSCIFPGYDRPANVNQAVAVVTVVPSRLDHTFLSGLLTSERGQRLLLSNRVEGARANISLTDLRELNLPVPPVAFQREFARSILEVEKLKVAHRASLAQLDVLFATLQHRAFRGGL